MLNFCIISLLKWRNIVKDKARNLMWNHPMLKKGGVHKKSNKAKRKTDKQRLRQEY